jgi:hypothetical protein
MPNESRSHFANVVQTHAWVESTASLFHGRIQVMLSVLRRARQRRTGFSVVYLLRRVVTSVSVSVTRSLYTNTYLVHPHLRGQANGPRGRADS